MNKEIILSEFKDLFFVKSYNKYLRKTDGYIHSEEDILIKLKHYNKTGNKP